MTGIVATIEHARMAGLPGQGVLCAPGIRAWARRHGIDLRRAAREGLPVDELERIGDAFALRLAAIARAAHEGQA